MPPPEPADWSVVEKRLTPLPRPAIAAFAARAARRVLPRVGLASAEFGADAWEWLAAADAAVRAVEAAAGGAEVSGFTLLVAAELPRAAANALSQAVRGKGPSAHVEPVETALAAAAFAADAARATVPGRAVKAAVQGAVAASLTVADAGRLIAFDADVLAGLPPGPVDPSEAGPLGELWPAGEPEWWAEVWAEFERTRPTRPALLVLPG